MPGAVDTPSVCSARGGSSSEVLLHGDNHHWWPTNAALALGAGFVLQFQAAYSLAEYW